MNQYPLLARENDELIHGVPAEEYFIQNILGTQSPFLRTAYLVKFKIRIIKILFGVIKFIFKKELYVENELRELYAIDARIRSLLLKLINKNIIVSWGEQDCYHGAPNLIRYSLVTKTNSSEGANSFTVRGFASGVTKNETLLPALAEILERYSGYVWKANKIIKGTYKQTQKKNGVDPKNLLLFGEDQQINGPGNTFVKFDNDAEFGWVYAQTLTGKNRRSALVPAQLAYMNYSSLNPQEPLLMEASSNGVAAGSSYEHAVYRAVCEAVERDGLMGFWLNKLSPPKIDLSTISIPVIQTQLAKLRKYNYELSVLDITTELNIPTFCAVLIDRMGGPAVSMSAVADFDINTALEKLMSEITKFAHYVVRENENLNTADIEKKYPYIINMNERRLLWSQKSMLPKINFFLQGRSKKFLEIKTIPTKNSYHAKFTEIMKLLQRKNITCYTVDITSPEAKSAGLVVVKAILPELIPLHFSEYRKHVGAKRLKEFPTKNGYQTNSTDSTEFNMTPHPFL